MSVFKKLTLSTLSLITGVAAYANEGGGEKAASLQEHFGLPITNSILYSVLITTAIIVLVRYLLGSGPSLVPSRGQAIIESAVDALKGLYEPIVGKKAMPMAFPVLITLFIFIVFHNWSGLIPGVGTIGWGHELNGSFHVTTPLVRPHTSEVNGTAALALISFGAWFIIVMRYAGPKVLLLDLFGNKADKKELAPAMYWALSGVFLLVGTIEVVSIFIRPITLSMRLFGNVFGGENLLHAMHFLPPFYFLELLVGFVQGLVFTLLSAVYIGLICNHGDEHHGDDAAHGHAKEAAH